MHGDAQITNTGTSCDGASGSSGSAHLSFINNNLNSGQNQP